MEMGIVYTDARNESVKLTVIDDVVGTIGVGG